MHELIAAYCNTLKLGSRIAKNYSQIEAETHEEFLAKLLAMEIEARELNRKNALLKQAQFDVLKTFGDFRFEKMSIPNTIDVEAIKTKYKKASEFIWVQEEPENMGYWNYLLRLLYQELPMRVISRKASASPATGYNKVHVEEQKNLVAQALSI